MRGEWLRSDTVNGISPSPLKGSTASLAHLLTAPVLVISVDHH